MSADNFVVILETADAVRLRSFSASENWDEVTLREAFSNARKCSTTAEAIAVTENMVIEYGVQLYSLSQPFSALEYCKMQQLAALQKEADRLVPLGEHVTQLLFGFSKSIAESLEAQGHRSTVGVDGRLTTRVGDEEFWLTLSLEGSNVKARVCVANFPRFFREETAPSVSITSARAADFVLNAAPHLSSEKSKILR